MPHARGQCRGWVSEAVCTTRDCRPCWRDRNGATRREPIAVSELATGAAWSGVVVRDHPQGFRSRPSSARAALPDCIHLGPIIEYGAPGCTKHVWACDVHERCKVYNWPDRLGLACCPCEHWRPAGTLVPAWTIRYDETNLYPSWPGKRFNTSLIEWGDGYLLAYRHGWSGSDIFLVRLGIDFRPVAEPVRLHLRHPDCNYGREDPRLFRHGGRLHVAFIGVTGANRIVRTNQMFARLSDDLKVEDVFHPHYAKRNSWEKNWTWWEYEGELFASYSLQPHRVLRIRGNHAEDAYETAAELPWEGGEIRGGSSPVRVGDEYYAFFHGRTDYGLRVYNTGVITWDAYPPFAIRRITPHPIMVANPATKPWDQYASVVFTCGAVRRRGQWVLSSGIHDRWTELHGFPVESIERSMVYVRHDPPPSFHCRPGTNDADIFASVVYHDEYRLPEFRADDVVIDVGGHVGSFAYAAWRRGSRRILSIEANPGNFAALADNATRIDGVTVRHAAVWSHSGGVVYSHPPANPDHPENRGGCWVSAEPVDEPVPTVSLDDLIEQAGGRVRFLKMDCESAEFVILPACTRLDAVAEIVAEYHAEPAPLVACLRAAGFAVSRQAAPDNPLMGLLFARRSSGAG